MMIMMMIVKFNEDAMKLFFFVSFPFWKLINEDKLVEIKQYTLCFTYLKFNL